MTRDLVTEFPAAKALAVKASAIVGADLMSIMHDGPVELLTETKNTQPALFLHEAMVLEVTGVHKGATALAGHSLGEYTALFAAGVLGFEDALKLVALRGKLMFESGENTPGTMAAVVGLDDEVVEKICATLNGTNGNTIVPANYNAPGQVVISGSRDFVRESLGAFKEAGAKIVKEIQVSGAFHSPLLKDAQNELTKALNSTNFVDAKMPVYVNVTGKPLTSSQNLREAAIEQLTSPVRWTQSISEMVASGVGAFVEVGPKNVLQGLIKRIARESMLSGIDTAEQCKTYLEGNGQ